MKLKQAKEFNNPNLTFVSQYEYTLGTDDLVPFGAAQYVLSPLLSLFGDFVFCVHLHAHTHILFLLGRVKVV